MNFKTFISLVVALSLGLCAAWIGRQLISGQGSATAIVAAKPMTSVVVAKHDLDPGQLINSDDLAMMEMPSASLPSGCFTDPEKLKDRAVTSAIVKGQVMFEGLLAQAGAEGGLSTLVPKGMRAVSVEVSESSGVSGLLIPGCRVDVIATLRQGDGQIARTIVENAKVQAVGTRFVRGRADVKEPAAKTVTLIVTSKDAEAIELASTSGRPRLVLRGAADNDHTTSTGVTSAELMGTSSPTEPAAQVAAVEPPKPAPPQPSRWPVQFIRGNSESTVYYEFWPKLIGGRATTSDPSVASSPAAAHAPENSTVR